MASIRVVRYGGKWAVSREGAEEPLSTHDTRDQAVAAGRATARADDGHAVRCISEGAPSVDDLEGLLDWRLRLRCAWWRFTAWWET